LIVKISRRLELAEPAETKREADWKAEPELGTLVASELDDNHIELSHAV
jgi:hypothetical protein